MGCGEPAGSAAWLRRLRSSGRARCALAESAPRSTFISPWRTTLRTTTAWAQASANLCFLECLPRPLPPPPAASGRGCTLSSVPWPGSEPAVRRRGSLHLGGARRRGTEVCTPGCTGVEEGGRPVWKRLSRAPGETPRPRALQAVAKGAPQAPELGLGPGDHRPTCRKGFNLSELTQGTPSRGQ